MAEAAQQSLSLACRKAVMRWAAIGAVASLLSDALSLIPYQPPAWANFVALGPISAIVMALNAPTILINLALPFSLTPSPDALPYWLSEALIAGKGLIINAGAYALVGGLACLAKRKLLESKA